MRKILFLLTALLAGVSGYALEQDADGYYLLGSVDDWKAFSEIVNSGTDPAANARMIADIDLGDLMDMIGTDADPYEGTFDANGYTLTVHYFSNDKTWCSPFAVIGGATIRNLHVAGNITRHNKPHVAGIVGRVFDYTSNVLERCRCSATLVGNYGYHGGLVGDIYFNATLTIIDCIFDGAIVENYNKISSALVGRTNSGCTLEVVNCFINGTFDRKVNAVHDQELVSVRNAENTYYTGNMINLEQGAVKATDEQLADGSIATALQAGRTEEVWVQDPETNLPALAVFSGHHLRKDADGYYLLRSRADWDAFAELVATEPAANARMVADIDLGDSQAQIGDTKAYTNPSDAGSSYHYQGTFDGQGHTLKVAYTGQEGCFSAPFPNTRGAKIRNLHVDGTIHSPVAHAGGIISCSWGSGNVVENCWVSAIITSSGQTWDECGAIIGCMKNGTVDINDCLFTGSMTSPKRYNGSFLGYKNAGTATINNCLSTGTFDYGGCDINCYGAQLNNCFIKQFPTTIPEAMRCTDEQLADGTIATALQAGRVKKIWVQDNENKHPIQRIFLRVDGDVNRDGVVDVDDVNILVNIILGIDSADNYDGRANVDHQGGIDVSDINAVISIITGK